VIPGRVNVLGVGVHPVNLSVALETIRGWITRSEPHYVCLTPAHGVMECYNRPELRPVFNGSGMTVPDGMSLVWLLQLKGYRQTGRVYGPDLMRALCDQGRADGLRHFLYGGKPGVVEKLASRLAAAYPGLQMAGRYTPPFGQLPAEEDERIAEQIHASRADVVWVGISTPRQEVWMAGHRGRVGAPVLIGVGAAFDFISGARPQAPRWVQRSGLEWLFRLAVEPRRLWPRYRQYPKFLALVVAQALGLLEFPDP
jgi:N-acetylglucosaminyldiphosphoundecaprenol N-acetyl-beta-D-mannosaminyltransferase